ncbi:MAG: 1-(5-phosphoribosyl)-5-[(5-phosphoribosylamino)methylideneamino]imidazole-4-carboxamide isomerase [Bacteroidetes bacterium]|nr:1-(5-phosphoribosyl)-5-[(5-phosphoribosylamino)methylideneamino]imidazole-4-carboxamide isomerase [Bacteroidota bacterium]
MIEIIPAIDIIDGNCVRLEKGEFSSKKVYYTDPVEVAKLFEDNGLKRLHLVDLDGARTGKIVNLKSLEAVASATGLSIDVGGGIRTEHDVELVLSAGASMVNLGSMAVKNPDVAFKLLERFGPDKIILGADVKNEFIAVSGWTEGSTLSLWNFLDKWLGAGIQKVCCTDISRDGMLSGPAFDLYTSMKKQYTQINVIASGGISNLDDVIRLNDLSIDGVIIGKAIYEGRIELEELAQRFL